MVTAFFGCERSGVCRRAFRAAGVDAWSCDLARADDASPHHFECDVFQAFRYRRWDFAFFFPPCDHLAVSGARWFLEKRADGRQQGAVNFFKQCWQCVQIVGHGGIENPIGIMSTIFRKPDQIIQPWQYGHGETKATCLWLQRLPLLSPTAVVEGRAGRVWKMPPSPDRNRLRSLTYEGIASAMVKHWLPVLARAGTYDEDHGGYTS